MKLLLSTLLFFLAHSTFADGYRKHLTDGQSYGISFNRPDTSVSLARFERNKKLQFLTDSLIQVKINGKRPQFDGWYEKQRIEDGNNIFLCMRIKEYGIWTRKTYWIHYEENGTRPAFRERVYIDADTNDLSDGNDLLVFQANYYASEIFKPSISDHNLADSSEIAVLRYIENTIEHNFRLYACSWIIEDHPAFPVVTDHVIGFYKSDSPRAIGGWDNRIYNDGHEVYLGMRGAAIDASVYILFHPVGNVRALHENGNLWVEYSTIYRSNKGFSWEIKEKVEFMEDRDYFVGVHGAYSNYQQSGVVLEQTFFSNGIRNGVSVINSEYGGKHSGGRIIGKTRVFPFYYNYNPQEIVLYKDSMGVSNVTCDFMLDSTPFNQKEMRRALRKYKRHCRKWKLEPFPSEQN